MAIMLFVVLTLKWEKFPTGSKVEEVAGVGEAGEEEQVIEEKSNDWKIAYVVYGKVSKQL